MITLQFICLFFGIWITLANSGRFLRGQQIEWLAFGLQSLFVSGFIYLTWC